MALIYISGRKEAVEVPNDIAKKIKARWGGLDAPKAASDDIVELEWITFKFGQIKTIELRPERKHTDEDYNRPLTSEERRQREATMKRLRRNLEAKGIIGPRPLN